MMINLVGGPLDGGQADVCSTSPGGGFYLPYLGGVCQYQVDLWTGTSATYVGMGA